MNLLTALAGLAVGRAGTCTSTQMLSPCCNTDDDRNIRQDNVMNDEYPETPNRSPPSIEKLLLTFALRVLVLDECGQTDMRTTPDGIIQETSEFVRQPYVVVVAMQSNPIGAAPHSLIPEDEAQNFMKECLTNTAMLEESLPIRRAYTSLLSRCPTRAKRLLRAVIRAKTDKSLSACQEIWLLYCTEMQDGDPEVLDIARLMSRASSLTDDLIVSLIKSVILDRKPVSLLHFLDIVDRAASPEIYRLSLRFLFSLVDKFKDPEISRAIVVLLEYSGETCAASIVNDLEDLLLIKPILQRECFRSRQEWIRKLAKNIVGETRARINTVSVKQLTQEHQWDRLACLVERIRDPTKACYVLQLVNNEARTIGPSDDIENLYQVYRKLSRLCSGQKTAMTALSNALFYVGSRTSTAVQCNYLGLAVQLATQQDDPIHSSVSKAQQYVLSLVKYPGVTPDYLTDCIFLITRSLDISDSLLTLQVSDAFAPLLSAVNLLVQTRFLVHEVCFCKTDLEILLLVLSLTSSKSLTADHVTSIYEALCKFEEASSVRKLEWGCLYYSAIGEIPIDFPFELVDCGISPCQRASLLYLIACKEDDFEKKRAICEEIVVTKCMPYFENDFDFLLRLHGYRDLWLEFDRMRALNSQKHATYTTKNLLLSQIIASPGIYFENRAAVADLLNCSNETLRNKATLATIYALIRSRCFFQAFVHSISLSEKVPLDNSREGHLTCMEACVITAQLYEFFGNYQDAYRFLRSGIKCAVNCGARGREVAYQQILNTMASDTENLVDEAFVDFSPAMQQVIQSALFPLFPRNRLKLERSKYQAAWEDLTLDPVPSILLDSAYSLPRLVSGTSATQELHLKRLIELLETLKHSTDYQHWIGKHIRAKLMQETISVLSVALTNCKPQDAYKDFEATRFSYVEKTRQAMISRGPAKHFHEANLQAEIGGMMSELQIPELENTIIVTMNTTAQNRLVITRITPRDNESVMLSLPPSRMSAIMEQSPMTFDEGLESLATLLHEVNEHGDINSDPKSLNKQETRKWWNEQKLLDSQMAKLFERLEHDWLGGFSGLFATTKFSHKNSLLKEKIEESLEKHIYHCGSRRPSIQVNYYLVELFCVWAHSDHKNPDYLCDLVYFILDTLQLHGVPIPYDEVDINSLIREISNTVVEFSKNAVALDHEPGHERRLVIIPDSKCQAVPWECFPCLKNCSVSRVLSLQHLVRCAKYPQSATRKAYYIINPGGDLQQTQLQFEPDFRLRGWKGCAGFTPREEVIIRELEKGSMFVYAGHGSGNAYIKPSSIKSMCQCGPVFLFGCSSARMEQVGMFETHGPPTDYAIAGCPLFLGTLWDVPDKDLNRFSREVLSRCFDEGQELSAAVREARNACICPYTTGAAPVIYGFETRPKPTQNQQRPLSA